ncbi:MAG: 4'-phosphopantetheinyl transferase superfamily protein [Anaerolineaceae bacterium]|jgi:4'-phosphopantetheinyl transferase
MPRNQFTHEPIIMDVESTNPTSNIWRLPPKEPLLADKTIHVYRLALDLPEGDIQKLSGLLTADEVIRANRFVYPTYRDYFIAGRAQLRRILSRYVRQSPEKIVFDYNEHGKPSLASAHNPVQFNIAHSHTIALVAINENKRIGVDLERVRTDIDYTQIAQQFFSPGELKCLLALPHEQQLDAFYACWTRKEALIKARGIGLAIPLDQFEVSLTPNSPPQLLRTGINMINLQDWSLYELRPGTGYIAALAVQEQDWKIDCWQWPTV